MVAAVLLVVFAGLGRTARKVTVPGLVVSPAGSIQVVAPVSGTIRGLRLTDGDAVLADQPLFSISAAKRSRNGATVARVAQEIATRGRALGDEAAAQQALAASRLGSLRARQVSQRAEIEHNDAESVLLNRRIELATGSVRRFESLAQDGFVSSMQVQQRQEELLDLQARRESVARSRSALERGVLEIDGEIEALDAQRAAERAQLERQRALVAQESAENDERREVLVAAPIRGSIGALTLHDGQAVREGQVLLTLVPDEAQTDADFHVDVDAYADFHARADAGGLAARGHRDRDDRQARWLEVELFAPSRAVGFVAPGQPVRLRLAAFPYQKFGMQRGHVISVSRTPLAADELPAGQAAALTQAARSNEPLFRIKVRLASASVRAYGARFPLRPGMALEADIQQESRAIWEWLLEPLFAAGQAA
ncbi:HlyD family secretion protein [Roseateles chitinivorans]|uniref:HlyD family secretion protein n=1 Tax=Roseateles chitinivorans TaxID=2917965 RepID=UPI003D67148F